MVLKTYIYYISRRVLRTMQNDFRINHIVVIFLVFETVS